MMEAWSEVNLFPLPGIETRHNKHMCHLNTSSTSTSAIGGTQMFRFVSNTTYEAISDEWLKLNLFFFANI